MQSSLYHFSTLLYSVLSLLKLWGWCCRLMLICQQHTIPSSHCMVRFIVLLTLEDMTTKSTGQVHNFFRSSEWLTGRNICLAQEEWGPLLSELTSGEPNPIHHGHNSPHHQKCLHKVLPQEGCIFQGSPPSRQWSFLSTVRQVWEFRRLNTNSVRFKGLSVGEPLIIMSDPMWEWEGT